MPPVVVLSSRRTKAGAATTSLLRMSRKPTTKSTSHGAHSRRRAASSAVIGTTVGPTKRSQRALLSPEAQQLARLLKQLNQDPANVVWQAVAAATTHSASSLLEMWKKGHDGPMARPSSSSRLDAARELAHRVQCAWEEHASTQFQNRQTLPRRRHWKPKRQMQQSHRFHETDDLVAEDRNSRNFGFPGSASSSSLPPPTTTRTTETAAAMATPLISSSSDSEDCCWMEEEEYEYDDYENHSASTDRNQHDAVAQQDMARTEFWQAVLAHVQLYVRAMTLPKPPPQSSSSPLVMYQVFALSGPTLRATHDDLIPIQEAVQRELWSHYDGSGGRPGGAPRLTECRVYAVLADEDDNDARLWMQVNLSHQTTTSTTTTNRPLPFTIVVQPETNFVAVSGSRSRWTPCVLAAVEAALTCGRGRRSYSAGGGGAGGTTDWRVAQRLDHGKGPDPCRLLQAAMQGGPTTVVGVEEDPVTALHRAATGSLYHPKATEPHHRATATAAVTPHGRNLPSQRDTESPDRRRRSCQRSLTDEELGPPVGNGVRWDGKGTATTKGQHNRDDEETLSLKTKSDDDDDDFQ